MPCGGAAANWVGLITQNVMREIYYTSGPSRKLYFGRHHGRVAPGAPRWQLVAPGRKAGDVIRALAWMGPEEAPDALGKILPRFSQEDCDELARRPRLAADLAGRDNQSTHCQWPNPPISRRLISLPPRRPKVSLW